jgi:hypothetical protein
VAHPAPSPGGQHTINAPDLAGATLPGAIYLIDGVLIETA